MSAGEAIGYSFALLIAVVAVLLGVFGAVCVAGCVTELVREWWRG